MPKETKTKPTSKGIATGKADKNAHGFGTKSIKKAVSKYGSDNIFFKAENCVFSLTFSLDFCGRTQ